MGEVDKSAAVEIARILHNVYRKDGIFGKRPPEEIIPNGISKGSIEHLLFITLTVSIDYMRPAEKLWEASRKTYEDPATSYLFYPEKVVEKSESDLKKDMQKYGLARRHNKDLKMWRKICETLCNDYESNPLKIIERCDYDALKLYKCIKKNKRKFPYLSGDKILPLWLRMVNHQAGIKLTNIDKIPIPVDTHVRRASVMLGVTCKCDNNIIRKRWSEILEGTEIYPILLDEPLWILSKDGCSKVKDNECPQANCCPVKNYCILYKEKQ